MKATPEKSNQVVAVGECTYKENISFNLDNNVAARGASRVARWGRRSGPGGSHVHKQLVIVCVSRGVLSGGGGGWGLGVNRVARSGRGSGHGGSHVHKQLVIVCVRRGVLKGCVRGEQSS